MIVGAPAGRAGSGTNSRRPQRAQLQCADGTRPWARSSTACRPSGPWAALAWQAWRENRLFGSGLNPRGPQGATACQGRNQKNQKPRKQPKRISRKTGTNRKTGKVNIQPEIELYRKTCKKKMKWTDSSTREYIDRFQRMVSIRSCVLGVPVFLLMF